MNDTTAKAAVIYARFSSERQRDESIDDQVRVCREWCAREGVEVVRVYSDRAMSGRTDHRPDFLRMVEEAPLSDLVVVYKLDRFSRDPYDAAVYKKRLAEKGVRVVSATENVPDTPEGIILEKLLEGMAAYYSRNLAQNVARGMEGLAIECKYNGSPVFGYRVGDDGRFEADGQTAPLVVEAFERVADGETRNAVARDWAARGVRNTRGSLATPSFVQKLIANERYMGVYIWGGVRVPGGMPRIVSDELWRKANDMAGKRARKGGGSAHDYELSGRMACGLCGGSYVGTSGRGKRGTVYHYYMCGGCGRRMPEWRIEAAIADAVREALKDEETVRRIAEKVAEIANASGAERLDALEKRAAELEAKQANLVKAIEDGATSAAVFARLDAVEAELARTKAQKKDAEADASRIDADELEAFFRCAWLLDDDRMLLHTMVSDVAVYEDCAVALMNFRDEKGEPSELVASLEGFAENDCGRPQMRTCEHLPRIVFVADSAAVVVPLRKAA